MSKIVSFEDGRLTQSHQVDLYDPENELWQEINRIDQLNLKTRQDEPLPDEVVQIIQILPEFIALLRTHPQIPIKPTTNIGGKIPLKLDLLGMYYFLQHKVSEGKRLDPERFFSESQKARELADITIKSQKPPLNNIDLLGYQQRCLVEIQEEVVDGFKIEDILTATAYGQRLQAFAIELGMSSIPSYQDQIQQLAILPAPTVL